MKINHAILHVFDFVSCVNVYAQEELDLSSKNAKRYVTSHAKKALGNIDSKRGEFAENSMFAEELRCYFRGQREFVDLSVQVAEFIAGELGRMEKTESADLLVVDFEDDPDNTVREMTDDEAEAAYRGEGKRYFAFMLLEAKQAYMHEVGYGESGAQRVDIARHHAILPNPSQKVASFAVIESKTLSVSFCDKERAIAGENRWLIPDGLLQCSMEASSKEVFDAVTRIVEEVAEEYGANAAVAVSKAKAYVAENADESDELAPWDLGEGGGGGGSRCRSASSRRLPTRRCPSAWSWRRTWPSAWRRATRSAPTRASTSRFRPSTARTPTSSSSSAARTASSTSSSRTSATSRTARDPRPHPATCRRAASLWARRMRQ